ncbi:MAG TPA: hypothetical protein VFQ45_21785 [Longimicrobium sp.]|nr:hypothetical protein [Longimicrobium sp.]
MGTLTKWVFFTLIFSAVPYGVTIALNRVQSPGGPLFHPSSEVLFIAIVTTSAALGELWAARTTLRRPTRWRNWSELALLFGVIISCIHYGAYVHHTLENPGRAAGVDCSIVATWGAAPGAAADALRMAVWQTWGTPCAVWSQAQEALWRWSLPMAIFWAATSTAAVAIYGRGGER